MYAIVQSGGKQFKVSAGDELCVEKLDVEPGTEISLEALMIAGDDGKVEVGKPSLGAKVKAKVVDHGRGDKIIVFHYAPKKNRRKKQGHRQPYTKIEVVSIG